MLVDKQKKHGRYYITQPWTQEKKQKTSKCHTNGGNSVFKRGGYVNILTISYLLTIAIHLRLSLSCRVATGNITQQNKTTIY